VTQFIPLLIQGVIYSAFAIFKTLWGTIKGLWGESHSLAIGWMQMVRRSKMDGRFEDPMFWSIRIFSFIGMFVLLKFIMDGLTYLVVKLFS